MEEHSAAGTPGFQDIFSLRRPRDAKAGFSSGMKSLGKGLVGGVVGLFAAPVVGATQDGFNGFAKGVATGAGAPAASICGGAAGAAEQRWRRALRASVSARPTLACRPWSRMALYSRFAHAVS
jgi:hypothetical protein